MCDGMAVFLRWPDWTVCLCTSWLQVNINSSNRRNILERMAATPSKISADLFDNAQLEIFKLLESDRCVNEPIWKSVRDGSA